MDVNVDMIFRIAAIGIIVAVLNQVLTRAGRDDQAMMTTLAGLLVVLYLIINMVSDFFQTVKIFHQQSSHKITPFAKTNIISSIVGSSNITSLCSTPFPILSSSKNTTLLSSL